ncbi:response regulator [Radiobacillus sp. PE A8.2]|uniref:response regulator transcription factor n=1 Tax=Radiobacillus sp. PE A8.2 TaxID=3380349 RepID=UPI00388E8FA5
MNVVVVDDQRLSRLNIINMINWNQLGLKLVGEYTNGKEAYESIRETSPDIIITDVRMPLMSGLQLAEKANDEFEDISFIIVSGFGDYEYVRKSLQLDAVDYILKPVEESELNQALEKTINKRLTIKQEEHTTLDKLRENFFYTYLGFINESDEKLNEIFKDIHFGSLDNPVCAIVLEHLPDEATKVIESYFVGCQTMQMKSRGVHLLIVSGTLTDVTFISDALKRVNNDFYCGAICIGPVFKGMENLVDSVRMAFDTYTLQKSMSYSDHTEPITYEQMHSTSLAKLKFNRNLEHEWLQKFTEGNWDEANLILHDILDIFKNSNPPNHHLIDGFFTYIFLKGISELYEMSIIQEKEFVNACEIAKKIPLNKDLNEKKRVITSFFKEVLENKTKLQRMKVNDLIQNAKDYVDHHYFENISLSDLAQRFYISPSYFSILFKQNYQVNFLEYLTNLRMKYAGQLLAKQPNKKIQEVAILSGYQDLKYFRKLFKRHYGCTPQEYKEDTEIATENT